MPPASVFLLAYIISMMAITFFLIHFLLSRSMISQRLFFLVVYIIIFMAVSTFGVSLSDIGSFSMRYSLAAIIPAFLYPVVGRVPQRKVEWRAVKLLVLLLAASVVAMELSMGFLYSAVTKGIPYGPLISSIDNPEFAIMMAGDAAFLFSIAKKKRDLVELSFLTFALSMSIMPNFFVTLSKTAILASTLASAFLMAVNIVFLYITQQRRPDMRSQGVVMALIVSNLFMMVGLAVFAVNRDLMVITVSMIFSMMVYFSYSFFRSDVRRYGNLKRNASILLLLINATELTMSFAVSTLGFQLTFTGSPYGSPPTIFAGLVPGMVKHMDFNNALWWLFPFNPYKDGLSAFRMGMSVGTPFAYFWSSFIFIMTVTMTPFYAIMMGSEMSYLVYERYRRSRTRQVKSGAAAILAGIPPFVILIPFYTPFYVFGMSGMLFAVTSTALMVSLGALVVALIFFGRRVQCNLVCMAAHMWTNTFYDQFRPRRNGTLWNYLRWVFFIPMPLFFGVYFLQTWNVLPPITLGKITFHPLNFYGMFILNYVWWFFYFLTPVFGTYSCARQGWCGFGTLAGIFNKIFFRLRIRDPSACDSCTTRECEGSCPVAIPLRTDFLKRGYSNRVSCVGCSNCIEACGQGNIYSTDLWARIRKRK